MNLIFFQMMMDQNSDVKLENLTQVSVHGSHLGQVEPMSDDVSDDPSSPESTTFDDSDLLSGGMALFSSK